MTPNLFSMIADAFVEPGTAARKMAERQAREAAPSLSVVDGGTLRDEAVDRVERAAPTGFLGGALSIVFDLAVSGDPFTSDDVWAAMPADLRPPEPRAMGAVMRRAMLEGTILPTAEYRASNRPECHRNPKRVWIAGPKAKRAA